MSEEGIRLPPPTNSTEPDNVSLRSSSAGKSGSSKSTKNTVPHYLRASTGSCHDLCKYGRKQEFVEKPWRPMRRNVEAKPPSKIDGQSFAEGEVLLPGRKKVPGVKLKPLSQIRSRVSDFHEIIKRKDFPKSQGNRRNSLATEFVDDRKSVDSETFSGWKKAGRASLIPSSECEAHMSNSVDIFKAEQVTKPPSIQNASEDGVHDLVKTELLSEEDKLETNLIPSCDSKSHSPASPDIVKHVESKNGIEDEVHDSGKMGVLSGESNSGTNLMPSLDASLEIAKHNGLENARGSQNSQEPRSLSEKEITARHNSSNSNAILHDDAAFTKHEQPSSGKLKVSSREVFPKANAGSSSLKKKPVLVKATASPDSSGTSNRKRDVESKMSNKAGASNVAVKKVQRSPAPSSKIAVGKVLASPRASASKVKACPTIFVAPRPVLTRVSSAVLRKQRSQKVSSSLKNHQKKNAELNQPADEFAEKTLYVIKVDSERTSLETEYDEGHSELHPSQSSLPNPQSSTTPTSVSKKEPRRTPKKAATGGGSEGKDTKSTKLNFQRGKVVDIHMETNSPRRLKYRRGRVVGENLVGKVRSLKQRGEVEHYTSCPQTDSEKVVLRHQDMVGKKDAQGLLNYLIEETASKLVETRKSKVKALVGAFESVISSKKPEA